MSLWIGWSSNLTKHTRLSFGHRIGGKKSGSGLSWLYLPFYWMFKYIILAMVWMVYGSCWLMWQIIKWPAVGIGRGVRALVSRISSKTQQ